ncbi:MAG: hypothetical protein J2P37_16840 [Ktedonobacteraceae bacterium]|nr:hypothetical protein [Ktedonobacteraceae bacterium]MBO0793635.1 hypothetical protein [Ktedonobacteraceae bacterium]
MEAEEILAQARSDEALPEGWSVFPLLRQKVLLGLLGWLFGIIVGLGLFALIAPVVIPTNYEHGVLSAIVTTLFLGVFLFVGLGSLYLFVFDIMRLRDVERHVIVVTPEYFVQQQGNKTKIVPLQHVHQMTARGVPPPDRELSSEENRTDVRTIPSIGESVMSFFVGRQATTSGQRQRRKRARTPTTLTFVDGRTEKRVVVANDNSYGDPFAIAAVIEEYTSALQQKQASQ